MKALQTEYHGILFRSRTEARWAVLFHELGLQWNYEPEGYALPTKNYLPDFYLPELKLFVEVKPDETDGSEQAVFSELLSGFGQHGVIAYGPPAAGRCNLAYFTASGAPSPQRYALFEDRRDEGIYWLASESEAFAIGGPGTPTDHDKWPVTTSRLSRAFQTAAKERFGIYEKV